MTKKILEILIPTYRRTNAAISAIESVLSCDNLNIGVACHSNGPDEELERFALLRPNLRYGFFAENRGAIANFRQLVETSKADYVFFLSDEDRVDAKHLTSLINFIANKQYGAVLCSVVEQTGEDYFSLSALEGEQLTFHDLLMIFPMSPTYISGYCFRRDLLSNEIIRNAFDNNEANVYPHVLLRNAISEHSSIGLFARSVVIKGKDYSQGGDSHAHVELSNSNLQMSSGQLLNPRIYGGSARARQFYYIMPIFDKQLSQISFIKRSFARYYLLSIWLNMTASAHLVAAEIADLPSLKSTIEDYRRENDCIISTVGLYNRILSIKRPRVKVLAIKLMMYLARVMRMIIFFRRFGVLRTYRQIAR